MCRGLWNLRYLLDLVAPADLVTASAVLYALSFTAATMFGNPYYTAYYMWGLLCN